MPSAIDTLKLKFRQGLHAEAIAGCEALVRADPSNREAKRTCAMMHALTRSFQRSLELLRELRDPAREDADILFNIGACEKELRDFAAAAQSFSTYTRAFPDDAGGWANLAECRFELDEFDDGAHAAAQAIRLDASLAIELAKPRVARGDAMQNAGRLEAAAADYSAALAMTPGDSATLKKATLCLLEVNRGADAIALCRDTLRAEPHNLTAKLGADWLLSQMVPLWHVPMMNEQERNQAFHDGLQAIDLAGKTVFEIGTGSGLLAMMAAKLGARQVVTCEAVTLIADTAARIVERNGFREQVTVLAKPSHAVHVGKDIAGKADVLVHEIFSSELLGEHVLSAIEDAKARLLKPGGLVLPAAASIMVALVGGEDIARNVRVDTAFGFDLQDFNAIQPRRRPLQREDLKPVLLSDAVEAFRFDFQNRSDFQPEHKRIDVAATQAGVCYGLIQWIRIEFAPGIVYENHPSQHRAVANWQHAVYAADEPIALEPGMVIGVDAWHDRSRPWFEVAAGAHRRTP